MCKLLAVGDDDYLYFSDGFRANSQAGRKTWRNPIQFLGDAGVILTTIREPIPSLALASRRQNSR